MRSRALHPTCTMIGLFGVRFAWPQLFLVTLVAHIAFGITLGLLTQVFLTGEDRGGLLHFLRGQGVGTFRDGLLPAGAWEDR